jgi:hypothetical protein
MSFNAIGGEEVAVSVGAETGLAGAVVIGSLAGADGGAAGVSPLKTGGRSLKLEKFWSGIYPDY